MVAFLKKHSHLNTNKYSNNGGLGFMPLETQRACVQLITVCKVVIGKIDFGEPSDLHECSSAAEPSGYGGTGSA